MNPMRSTGRTLFTTLGAALLAAMSIAGAPEGPGPGEGGAVKTAHYHFEAVFTQSGIALKAHGLDNKALETTRLAATATFYHPNASTPWFSYDLQAVGASPGQAPGALQLAIDLSKVPRSGVKVTFQVNGLPDPAEPAATFTVPFVLSGSPPPGNGPRVVPATLTVTRATAADQAAIKAQRVCKVSGEPLGSMGTPVKITRGDRSIFLCCNGCVKRVQANPDQYLGTR
jgi:hypothetical protein